MIIDREVYKKYVIETTKTLIEEEREVLIKGLLKRNIKLEEMWNYIVEDDALNTAMAKELEKTGLEDWKNEEKINEMLLLVQNNTDSELYCAMNTPPPKIFTNF